MAIDDGAAGDGQDRTGRPPSRLFAVRLWTEDVAGGQEEYRGSVRDVVSGAFRSFRDWSDLIAFIIDRMQEVESAQAGHTKGETGWPLEKR